MNINDHYMKIKCAFERHVILVNINISQKIYTYLVSFVAHDDIMFYHLAARSKVDMKHNWNMKWKITFLSCTTRFLLLCLTFSFFQCINDDNRIYFPYYFSCHLPTCNPYTQTHKCHGKIWIIPVADNIETDIYMLINANSNNFHVIILLQWDGLMKIEGREYLYKFVILFLCAFFHICICSSCIFVILECLFQNIDG